MMYTRQADKALNGVSGKKRKASPGLLRGKAEPCCQALGKLGLSPNEKPAPYLVTFKTSVRGQKKDWYNSGPAITAIYPD